MADNKRFWLTEHRERDILRYSVHSDQKDATAYTFEEACEVLYRRNAGYRNITKGKPYAVIFLEAAIEHAKIYNDWIIYASREAW